jgi:multisubunit Na+/H+ antiporter MnhG subunit
VSIETLVEWILVGLGVSAMLACSLGVLFARDALDRLHYAAAASLVGPVPIAVAVLVKESFTQPAVNALFVAVMLLVLQPLLAIETARALRRGEHR